ncbi:MAG: dihydroneopterin aldolase, partial [Staphylococcus equorum]|nr:dihydroneopterin aldolase [Staphylococcus equorum]
MKKYNKKHINDLSESELARLASGGQLIDVRTEEEYELGHI